jgi:hypothetical protein
MEYREFLDKFSYVSFSRRTLLFVVRELQGNEKCLLFGKAGREGCVGNTSIDGCLVMSINWIVERPNIAINWTAPVHIREFSGSKFVQGSGCSTYRLRIFVVFLGLFKKMPSFYAMLGPTP